VALAWTAPQPASGQLASRQKSVIERALRESLTNALKHAQPRRIEIDVELDGDVLALSVRNDGTAPDPAQWAEGRGLRGMRHRLDEYGAVLHAAALPGGWTELSLRLPLTPETML